MAENHDVPLILVTLIDVWTKELIADGRIELENLLALETQTIDWGEKRGTFTTGEVPRIIRRVVVRGNKKVRRYLHN